MHSRWEALQAALDASLSTLQAAERYRGLRARASEFGRFSSIPSLLGYFADLGGDLDEKDRIYAALVVEAQATVARTRDLARSLLWCGLWPALEAIYRRRRRAFDEGPEELVQELTLAFSTVLQRLDLSKVNRVAATIVRNTERVLLRDRPRAQEVRSRRADVEEAGHVAASGYGTAEELNDRIFWRDVAPVLRGDASLVMAVIVEGRNQVELAKRLGISYEATRKRYVRALQRLREVLEAELASTPRSPQQIDAR